MLTIDKKTKFEQVRDSLREMLLSGQLSPGSRFYSENKLTSMFGVARMTVNKALTVLENEGLLNRVQGKGTFVAKRVDKLRSERDAVRRQPIALVTSFRPQDVNSLALTCMQCINYIDDKAYDDGYSVTVFNLQGYDRITDEVINELSSNKYSSILLYHLPECADFENEILRLKKATSTPIVLGGEISELVDCIDYDQYWIGWRGGDYLMELGHRKLAFLGYHSDFSWMHDRIAGFTSACEAGFETCESHRIFYISGNRYCSGSMDVLAGIFDDIVSSCTALMCANDELVSMFMEIASQRNIKVPEDISIIGADDNIVSRDLNITTFKITGDEIARSCLDIIEKRISLSGGDSPEKILLKPRLLERGTARVCERMDVIEV